MWRVDERVGCAACSISRCAVYMRMHCVTNSESIGIIKGDIDWVITTESLADLGVACFPGADLGVEPGCDRVGQAWA